MIDITTGLEKTFDDRKLGESSVSKYIQSKIPNESGYTSQSLEGTPDDKIIKPNLKSFKCETISFKLPFGLGAIPIPIPFIKQGSNTEIKEILPDKSKSEYGKIKVTESKGGFVELKDDTPGNKRLLQLHPSGSYHQVLDNGSTYDKVVNDALIIIDKNWNIAIGNDFVEVITGNNKIQIKKDSLININGDESKNIDKNSITNIKENFGLHIEGSSLETIGKDKTLDVAGTLTETIQQNYSETVQGEKKSIIMNNKTETIGQTCNILVGNTLTITSASTINIIAPKVNIN